MKSFSFSVDIPESNSSFPLDTIEVKFDDSKDEDLVTQISKSFATQFKSLVEQNSFYERFEVDSRDDLDSNDEFKEIVVNAIFDARDTLANESSNPASNNRFDLRIESGSIAIVAPEPPTKAQRLEELVTMELYDKLDEKGWFEDNSSSAATSMLGNDYAEVIASQIREGLKDNGHDLDDVFNHDFELMIEDLARETVASTDKSSPLDLLEKIEIRMVYVPLDKSPYLEDGLVICDNVTGSPFDVVPDDGFKSLLKMTNVAPLSYVNAVKDIYRVDVLDEETSDLADEWKALVETPLRELGINPRRTPALTAEELTNVILNTNGNGSPSFSVNMTPKTIMAMSPEKDVLVHPRGGMIGVHDFISGSGEVVQPSGPVVLPADPISWRPEKGENSFRGFSMDDVYGMTNSAFEAKIELVAKQKDPQLELELSAPLP